MVFNKYTCFFLFVLLLYILRVCIARRRTETNAEPTCEEITPFYGGTIYYFGKRKIWSQAIFSCSEDFSMFPENPDGSECTEDLEWIPKPQECYKKARVQKPANSYITKGKDILLHNESFDIQCNSSYEMYRNNEYLEKTTEEIININGTLHPEIPECVEARCLFSGYPINSNTFHRIFNSSNSFLVPGTYVYPKDEVEVTCTNPDDFELFVNSTNTYLEDFSYECRFGQFDKTSQEFPVCLEKGCHFKPHPDVCFSTSDDGKCRGSEFKVHSRSTVDIRCTHGYTLYRSQGGVSVKVSGGEMSVMCKKGTFFKDFMCVPVDLTDLRVNEWKYDCILPCNIDDRLSVTYSGELSLSGGSKVSSGDFVHFNCSKVDVQKFEPFNRRFKCIAGQWIEDEKDKTWTFGNKGTFPFCREAICEPECLNGGLCRKDNVCDCKPMTEGERCEKSLCNSECTENGGECVAPGHCKCPPGRHGPTCDIKDCILPDLSANTKSSKIRYKPGETISDFQCDFGYILSPHKKMTCKKDGTWSNIVQCEKANIYLIRVKTETQPDAGTDANVYIYLHGDGGKTDRIYLRGGFEAGDLDMTRIFAKDVRPITGVYVGHDGKGLHPDWFLQFASIFVENINEYYVFRGNKPVWIDEREDKYFPRQGCIYTYDSGNAWKPRWNSLRRGIHYHYIGDGSSMSLRECKQMCTELSIFSCVSVQYSRRQRNCWGFSGLGSDYFSFQSESWESPIYLQVCKNS